MNTSILSKSVNCLRGCIELIKTKLSVDLCLYRVNVTDILPVYIENRNLAIASEDFGLAV